MNDQQIAEFMRRMYGYGAKQTLRTIETVLQKARAPRPNPSLPKPLYIGRIETNVKDSTFKPEDTSLAGKRNLASGAVGAKHRQEHIDLMNGKIGGQDVSMFAAGQHKTVSGERPYTDPDHPAHVTADAGPRGYLMYHPDTADTKHAGTTPSELWRHGVRTTSPSGQIPVFKGRDDAEQRALESKTRAKIYEILNRGVDNGWAHEGAKHAGLVPRDYDPTDSNAAKDKAAATRASHTHFDAHIAAVASAIPPPKVESDAKPVAEPASPKRPAPGTGIARGGSVELALGLRAKDALKGAATTPEEIHRLKQDQALKDFKKIHTGPSFPLTEEARSAFFKEKKALHESRPKNKNVPFDQKYWEDRLDTFAPIVRRQQAAREERERARASKPKSGEPKPIQVGIKSRLDLAVEFASRPIADGNQDLKVGTREEFAKLPQDIQDKHFASADSALRTNLAMRYAGMPKADGTRDIERRQIELFDALPKDIREKHLAAADETLATRAANKQKILDQNARGQASRGKKPEERAAETRAKRLAREAPARAERAASRTAAAEREARAQREAAEREASAQREAAAKEYGGGSALAAAIQSTPDDARAYPGPHHLLQQHRAAYEKHGKSLGEHEKIPELANMDGRAAHEKMKDINDALNSDELGSENSVSPKMALISAQYEALHDRHRIASLPKRERELPEVQAYKEALLDWHTKVVNLKGKKDASGAPRPIPPPPFMENDQSTRLHPALRKFLRNPFAR